MNFAPGSSFLIVDFRLSFKQGNNFRRHHVGQRFNNITAAHRFAGVPFGIGREHGVVEEGKRKRGIWKVVSEANTSWHFAVFSFYIHIPNGVVAKDTVPIQEMVHGANVRCIGAKVTPHGVLGIGGIASL